MAINGSKIFRVCDWVVDNWLTIGWQYRLTIGCKMGCKIGFKISCKIGCKKIYWRIFKKKNILTNFQKNILTKKAGSSLAG